jgi:hypothetical protein
MSQIKLALPILGFLIFFILFSFVWFSSLTMQYIGFTFAFFLAWSRLGTHRLFLQLKLLAPFVIILAIVYALFILIGISPQGNSAWDYWYVYGSTRTLLLLSTILMFRVCFSLISFNSLLLLNPSIHLLKYIILGRILYRSSVHTHARICFWHGLIPTEQISKQGLGHRFMVKLASALAMTLYVLAEAELKGKQIDNRIQCCYKEKR